MKIELEKGEHRWVTQHCYLQIVLFIPLSEVTEVESMIWDHEGSMLSIDRKSVYFLAHRPCRLVERIEEARNIISCHGCPDEQVTTVWVNLDG